MAPGSTWPARDVRYGLRQVRRNPAFSAIAIATLALGIGGITAMFSAFDAVLIRPLPYADADRLVMIWDDMGKTDITARAQPHTRGMDRVAPSQYRIHGPRVQSACRRDTLRRRRARTGSGTQGRRGTSGACWACSRLLGRVFTEDEDNKGVRVVVISHGLWQRRFGGASDVIGRKISLNDEPYEVIGVMPRDFYFMPSRDIDIWMPASFPPWMRRNFTWHDAQIVARLKPGVTLEHATAIHGGVEPAGDGEGLPRPAFGDRHASARRDRGQEHEPR